MAYSKRSTNSLDDSIRQEASEETALQEMEVELINLGDIEQELKLLENLPSEQTAQNLWRDEADEEERKGEQNQQIPGWQHFNAHDPATPSTSNAMMDFNLGFIQHPLKDPNTDGSSLNLRTPSAAAEFISDPQIVNTIRGKGCISPRNDMHIKNSPIGDWSAFPSREYSPKAHSKSDMSIVHMTTPSSLPSLSYVLSASQKMAFGATDVSQNASIVAPVAIPPSKSYWSGTTSLSDPSVSSHSEQNLSTKDCSSEGSLKVSSEESHTACSSPQEPPVIPSSTLNPSTRKSSFKYINRRQFLEGEKKMSYEHQPANNRSRDCTERQEKDKLSLYKAKEIRLLEEENEKLKIKCNELEALRDNYQALYNEYKDYMPSIPKM